MVLTEYDVIIIGGGPAGSTAASLLARSGRRVLLLEKEKFPRYHIGESLVLGLMPVLDDLGVRSAVESGGFLRKYGSTLRWGAERDLWTVRFAEVSESWEYTFQVKRAEFDNLLLGHSRKMGATVVEEATVTDVVFDAGRCAGVRYILGKRGTPTEVRATYVLDASGQAKLLAHRENLINWHEDLRNIAVWTYFQGGTQLDGLDRGNILTEYHEDGWVWVIPFHDGTRSVGFVSPREVYTASQLSPPEYFESKLELAREAKRLLTGAARVADYRVTKDWSYACTRFGGPGYLLAGDAAAFVDPLFSTGVMLAMRSAAVAAHALDGMLADPAREEAYRLAYETSYRDFFDTVVSFVRYFYDARRKRVEYWARAQELIDPVRELEQRADFIKMINGILGQFTVVDYQAPAPVMTKV